MARELDVNIVVNDEGAKQQLADFDGTVEATAAQLSAARTEVANIEAAFKQLGVSVDGGNRMLDAARAKVAALEAQLGTSSTATKDLGSSADATGSSMNNFASMVDRVIERMAIYATVRGVIGAIEGTIQWGLELEKLSAQTGISVETIQELNFAAIQTAVPLTTITQAITQMERKIGEDDGNLIQALGRLGLSFGDIKKMSADQAFDVITSKMRDVTDQFDFAADAAQIFNSRSGTSIAAVILQWEELKKKADAMNVVLSKDEVDALAQVAKGWETAKAKAEAYLAVKIVNNLNQRDQFDQSGLAAAQTVADSHLTREQLAAQVDAQLAGMNANAKAPTLPSSAQVGGAPILNPDDAKQLAALDAIGKELTATVNTAISAEHELSKAQAEADQIAMTGLTARLTNLKTLETESAKAYSTEGQIANLRALDAAEQALAITVGKTLNSDKDRAKVEENLVTRHLELMKQETSLQEQRANEIDAALYKEMTAQIALNKAWGEDADGSIHVQLSALEILDQKIARLTAEDGTWVGTKAQQALLEKQYTDALYDEAVAQDSVYQATLKTNDAALVAVDRFKNLTLTIAGTVDQMSALRDSVARAANVGTLGAASNVSGSGATVGNLASAFASTFPGLPGRAAGGPVTSGQPYLVGERGPELFTPQASGAIAPSGAMGGISIGDIHIHGNVDSEITARRFADQVADRVLRRVQTQGKVGLNRS